MNIVIVGAGNVGRALAGGWAKAGHKVTFALRDPARPEAAALKRQGVDIAAAKGAAANGEVIVLAVPWTALPAAIEDLGPVKGKVIVDATNPLNADLSLAIGFDDSAGETVAELAPDARVVKAFNTTGAGNMADSLYPGGKLMMPVAGDDAGAKQTVMSLAADLGFDPVDVGPLVMSRSLEPMAVLWIKLAYAQKQGMNFGFGLLRK
jgi:8-hydroxy-5-deazaflavin:NADPH oxidoreductase